MSELTNTLISTTYLGVLHANGGPIPLLEQQGIYDGMGNKSALSLGRETKGATVTGNLKGDSVIAGELTMPNVDTQQYHIPVRTSAGLLELKSIAYALPTIDDGIYTNPKITVVGGLITSIVSRPTLSLLDTPVTLIDVPRSIGNANAYLHYTYPNSTNNTLQYITVPDIDWSALSDYSADARYALIKTKIVTQSNGGDFEVTLSFDSKVVGYSESREDHRSFGVDTSTDTTHQFFAIPLDKTTETILSVHTLPGTTNNNGYNQIGVLVTLEGWMY